MRYLHLLSAVLSHYAVLFVTGLGVLAYLYPAVCDWVKGSYATWILSVIMLSMGMTLSLKDFKILASRPWQIALGTLAQFTIMPVVAWIIIKVFSLSPIRKLTGVALKLGTVCGLLILAVCMLFPNQVLSIFTSDPIIITEGRAYLRIIQHTFVLFILSHVLMATLRSVEIVNISFAISVVSLIVDVTINYTLIFGKFGFPELGVTGAAIGTLTARVVELAIVLWYMIFKDTRLRLFSQNFLRGAGRLSRDYAKIATPVMAAGLLWAVSVPLQSAVLGHLPGGVASDAIAANSVSSTFYQYLKVVVIAMASASGVMIGKAIGAGDMQRVRAEARSMSVIDVCVGIILGMILLAARRPLLSMYTLNDQALRLANQFMYVLCFVMIGMSYQMPVASGIIRGAGDTRFSLILNMVSTWGIVMPLTFLSAFVWKWPPAAVVCVIQSDQIFKGLPIFLRFRSYKWIKKLTRSA